MSAEMVGLGRLFVALGLSTAIGFEREMRQKSAGLRTHTLVGVGAALFMLISQFGFASALGGAHIELDASRVAAQIVSGVGFLGAGIIFVRRDTVKGLTTAAGIWLTAAIGTAAGGGLLLLATTATGMYFLVAYVYPWLVRRTPQSRWAPSRVRITYTDGRGILRDILAVCSTAGFEVIDVGFSRAEQQDQRAVTVDLQLRGGGAFGELVSSINDLDGTLVVEAGRSSDLDA